MLCTQRNNAQMLRDLLCTTKPSIRAAHLQCCIIFLSVQTTGKIGPILDQHSAQLLHIQPLEPLAMSSFLTSAFVGLFRRIITTSASEIAGLGSAAQGATFGPVFSVGKLNTPAAWTHVVDY